MTCTCVNAILVLKVLQIFNQAGALHFYFALGPATHAAGPAWWLDAQGEATTREESKTSSVLWPG